VVFTFSFVPFALPYAFCYVTYLSFRFHIDVNGVATKNFASDPQWGVPQKPFVTAPLPTDPLYLVTPTPLSAAQKQDLSSYLTFVPQDKQAFLRNIIEGGLGFEENRAVSIVGPQEHSVPSCVPQITTLTPSVLPKIVVKLGFERGKEGKVDLLQFFSLPITPQTISWEEAEKYPNFLQDLRREHPVLFKEYENFHTVRTSTTATSTTLAPKAVNASVASPDTPIPRNQASESAKKEKIEAPTKRNKRKRHNPDFQYESDDDSS
jgi:hypothetical protein